MHPSEIIMPLLDGKGFKKKDARLWLRQKDDCWNLVGLQKSNWGNQFYINLGVWLPALNPNPRPRIQDCHIQVRLDGVASNDTELERVLNFEDEWKVEPDQRKFELYCAFRDAEQKCFDVFTSLDAVRRYFASHPTGHFAIQRELAAALHPSHIQPGPDEGVIS
jgi:hypothetical protein